MEDGNFLHPYRTAELYLMNNVKLGVFGQIHPVFAKDNNISSELFLFEFDLENFKVEFQNQTLSLYKKLNIVDEDLTVMKYTKVNGR